MFMYFMYDNYYRLSNKFQKISKLRKNIDKIAIPIII